MQRYNGQLINQFANVINGNAAAGALVTVKLKETGATVTLYAEDNLSGATLANPLTADAKGYYGFYAPDGVYTLDVSISGTPQLEIQLLDAELVKWGRENLGDSFSFNQVLTTGLLRGYVGEGYYFGTASNHADIPSSGLNPANNFIMTCNDITGIGRFIWQRMWRHPTLDRWWDRIVDTTLTDNPAWTQRYLPASDSITSAMLANASVTRAKLAANFEYNTLISSGTINTAMPSGVTLLSVVTAGDIAGLPSDYGTGLGFLEVWGSTDYFVQRLTKRNNSKQRWIRDVRVSTTTYNAWRYDGLERTDFDRFAGKKIAFLGDSITASYLMPEQITANLAATMYNFGIGGTRAGDHVSTGFDELSGYQLANAINSGNWTDPLAGANYLNTSDPASYAYILARVTAMAALDWSTIDYLVIGYGTNDFGGGNAIGTPSDTTGATYYGGINIIIEQILDAYPNIKLLFWSPIWRRRTPTDPSGIAGGSDVSPNTNGDFLYEYVEALQDACKRKHVECIDLYYTSGIFETTYLHYLVDELHPTTAGSALLAAKISGALQSKF